MAASQKKPRNPIARLISIPLKVVLGVVLAAVLAVGVANAVTIGTTRGDMHVVADLTDYNADAIVVLGASVHPDGTPSDMLRHRLDTAWALYDAGAADAIIVSGDNRAANYNESAAMKAYLVGLGIPSQDIYEDHAGYSTYESMYRARHVFGAQRIIVTTQAYHLYRSLYAAHGLGMEAVGVASDHGAYLNQTSYSLREVLARTKDFFNTLVQNPQGECGPIAAPGEQVSLAESGDLS